MDHLDLDPRRAVFPRRCLACGAAPERAYTLVAQAGLDLLMVVSQTCVELEVPLCAPCGRRKGRGRVAWFVGIIGGFFAFCTVVPVAQGLFPSAHGVIAAAAAAVLVPTMLGGLWWMRNREDRLYHRWFSPAWIVAFDERTMIARLGFHDARTWREVGVLSGVLSVGEGAAETGYREHAAPVPAPFSPPERPFPWWSLVLLGLGAMGGAVAEYLGLLGPDRRRSGPTRALDDLVHHIGGSTGALVLWLSVGLAFVGLGLAVRRGQRRGRD